MSLPTCDVDKHGIFNTKPEESAKTTIVMGKSMSGKTHFLVDQLNSLEGLTREVNGVTRPIYDKIVIMTESLNAEPFSKLSKNLPVIFIKGYMPKFVMLLKKLNDETDNKFKWLVVLDDCVGSVSGRSLRGGVFPKQMLTYRNAGISTIVCVQSVTLLEPKSRENAHRIVITGMKAKDEIKVANDLLYDSVLQTFPEWSGMKVSKEQIAKRFFDAVNGNILFYDNLNHCASIIPRDFKP